MAAAQLNLHKLILPNTELFILSEKVVLGEGWGVTAWGLQAGSTSCFS